MACRPFSSCGLWAIELEGFFAQQRLWDLNSLARDQTHVAGFGKWILNHWNNRIVPGEECFCLLRLIAGNISRLTAERGSYPEQWPLLSFASPHGACKIPILLYKREIVLEEFLFYKGQSSRLLFIWTGHFNFLVTYLCDLFCYLSLLKPFFLHSMWKSTELSWLSWKSTWCSLLEEKRLT